MVCFWTGGRVCITQFYEDLAEIGFPVFNYLETQFSEFLVQLWKAV